MDKFININQRVFFQLLDGTYKQPLQVSRVVSGESMCSLKVSGKTEGLMKVFHRKEYTDLRITGVYDCYGVLVKSCNVPLSQSSIYELMLNHVAAPVCTQKLDKVFISFNGAHWVIKIPLFSNVLPKWYLGKSYEVINASILNDLHVIGIGSYKSYYADNIRFNDIIANPNGTEVDGDVLKSIGVIAIFLPKDCIIKGKTGYTIAKHSLEDEMTGVEAQNSIEFCNEGLTIDEVLEKQEQYEEYRNA